jgi:hypothetical protein
VKVWTCTGFDGHYPVGTAAVVVAETAEQAADELNRELRRRGLAGDVTSDGMRELETETPGALVLADGNY